jgi:hypothetical protein
MSSCCLFPFCFCLLALVRFYFFAHSTTPAWLKHHVFFFLFIIFLLLSLCGFQPGFVVLNMLTIVLQ